MVTIEGNNYSYDYSGLIEELEADLEEKLIDTSTIISVVRDKETIAVDVDYHPIIDYYYPGFENNTPDKLYNRDEFTQEEIYL